MSKKLRKPEEEVFNSLMVRETLISGMTIGIVAFAVWAWLMGAGYEVNWARNLLLLLKVLFEIYMFSTAVPNIAPLSSSS